MTDLNPFFATSIDPPYFATVFSWTANPRAEAEAHEAFAAEIFQEAATVPGFIGVEHCGSTPRQGVSVTYWETRAGLSTWVDRVHPVMTRASAEGASDRIFDDFILRLVRVEKAIYLHQMGTQST